MYGGFGGFSDNMMGGFFPSPQKNKPSVAEPSARDVQGLMPVTIKMIIEATLHAEGSESNAVMRFHNNHEASQVEILAQVIVAETITDQMFAKYILDDGTGTIVCKRFIDADRLASHTRESIPIGKFVRVIGPFRRFGSESYINAHRIEQVRNLDDISRHRIEVIHTMLQLNGLLDESQGSGAVSMHTASITSASEISSRPHESMSAFH